MKLVVAFVVLVFVAGCASDPLPSSGYFNPSLYLSASALQKNAYLASNGDGEAAYRLFLYYSFYLQNVAEGDTWLQKASDLGLPEAQSAMGRRLVKKPNDTAKEEGLALILVSAENGEEPSLGFLKHLRYLQAFTEDELRDAQRRVPEMIDLVRYLQWHPRDLSAKGKPNKAPPTTIRPFSMILRTETTKAFSRYIFGAEAIAFDMSGVILSHLAPGSPVGGGA